MIKKYLDNINWKSFLINFVISIVAIVVCEFGISCYYTCGLGTDPVSVVVDGQHNLWHLSYGNISTINNIVWVILFLIFMRDQLGLGTIVTVIIGGPFIDIFNNIMMPAFPSETTSLFIRILILLVGAIVFGVGTGLSIACNMGIGTWSFLPLYLTKVTPLKISVTQMITDGLCLIVGWLLGGVVGIGTVVGVLSTGPIINWTMKITQPIFEKIGPNYKN